MPTSLTASPRPRKELARRRRRDRGQPRRRRSDARRHAATGRQAHHRPPRHADFRPSHHASVHVTGTVFGRRWTRSSQPRRLVSHATRARREGEEPPTTSGSASPGTSVRAVVGRALAQHRRRHHHVDRIKVATAASPGGGRLSDPVEGCDRLMRWPAVRRVDLTDGVGIWSDLPCGFHGS